MSKQSTRAAALALALACFAEATTGEEPERLLVQVGRPLRVALDERLRVKRAGQTVTATLVEPLYSFDRIVVPAGTRVLGAIESLKPASAGARFRGIFFFGDFSPSRQVTLRFDRLVSSDGQQIPIETRVGPGTSDVVMLAAGGPRKGVAAREAEKAKHSVTDAVAAVKRPGRMRRLKEALLASLPFHAQYVRQGTVYDAELLTPLDFRSAPSNESEQGTPGPTDGILSVRLVTPLDSANTPRGTAVRAVLTRPLFSADDRLVFAEGTELRGEVTFAKPAGHFRHNGELRFLFEEIRAPGQDPESHRAALQSAETARDAHLAIDDEGGARVTNPKTRFIAPALSIGALSLALRQESVYDPGEAGYEAGLTESSSSGSSAAGFSGLAFLGVALSQLSHPAGVALGFVGVARSVYGSVIGKGREVSFPAGTRMQLQLAPAPSPAN